jgi:HNH endonuclease
MTTYTQLLLMPCLEWDGFRDKCGYGRIGKKLMHRLEWERQVGLIPKGLCVLHHCDNPPCYEITHLWLGTQAENMLDRDNKGRGRPQGKIALTVEQVQDIRSRAITGRAYHPGNYAELAEEYGLSLAYISGVVAGTKPNRMQGLARARGKLTDEQVQEIRACATPNVRRGQPGNYKDLAAKYDVTYNYIAQIVAGRHR